MSGPRYEIRRRRKYAAVEVDLWPTAYDLSPAGATACNDYLHEVLGPPYGRAGIRTASHTFICATRVPIERADEVLAKLLAIVAAPENLEAHRT